MPRFFKDKDGNTLDIRQKLPKPLGRIRGYFPLPRSNGTDNDAYQRAGEQKSFLRLRTPLKALDRPDDPNRSAYQYSESAAHGKRFFFFRPLRQ